MYERQRDKANALAHSPGVYLMKDAGGRIIYIGKAKDLKNRVSQYFRETEQTPKVRNMVSCAEDFEVILTDSELEALVLESSLIKRHKPKYNILLKDDKGYPFIRVNPKEPYTRLSIASKKANDGAFYFGPYGGRNVAGTVIDTINRVLKFPSCARRFPADIGRARPCINYQIGRCAGVCTGEVSEEEYAAMVAQAVLLLEGKNAELARRLETEMEQASKQLKFEKAAHLRDRLHAVQTLGEKQKIISGSVSVKNMDVIGLFAAEPRSGVAVLHYVCGTLAGKDYAFAGAADAKDGPEMAAEFISGYYGEHRPPPALIAVSCMPEDCELLRTHLASLAGRNVEIGCPIRGEKVKLTAMAVENAKDEVARALIGEERTGRALNELKEILGLAALPRRIEAFDISNTGKTGIAASMVVLMQGRPYKKDYRRFKITQADVPDDYHSMYEAVYRRLLSQTRSDKGFEDRPDLILADGGRGQAAAAAGAAAQAGIEVPVYGMVKDDRHRTRAIVGPDGSEYGIDAHPAVFAMITRLQDEAHRFAVEYHRTLRAKRGQKSSIDDIPGVGPARKKALLRHFGGVGAVAAASKEELAAVVPSTVAQNIKNHFEGRRKTT